MGSAFTLEGLARVVTDVNDREWEAVVGHPVGQPVPPLWAARTVDEQGRMVHERLASLHPLVLVDYIDCARPTDVSVSVMDVPKGGAWRRREPTAQVEGGSYALVDAWQLYAALREVLSAVDATEPAG